MSLKKNKLKPIDGIFLYKCFFMLYTVFLATEFSKMRSFTLIKLFIFGFGIIIFFYEIYKTKGYYIMKNKLLLLFMILNTVTIIVNNGKLGNFKFYLITLIELFVLTSIDKNKNIDSIKSEFKKLNFTFIIATLFLTMIGVVMYIFNLQTSSFLLTDSTRSDLIKGIYIISTSAGLICYLSLSVTIISLLTEKDEIKNKRFKFILYIVNILVQSYGLILSGARGSLISFIAFSTFLIILLISKKKIHVLIITFLLGLSVCFILSSKSMTNIDFLDKGSSGDFFSGRLILWENGYKNTFKNYKFLGPGPGNMVEITNSLSDTYLPGIEGGRLHNVYLDVLCSNGMFGFLIFMAFIIFLVVSMYKNSFNNMIDKEDRIYIKLIFAFITSILVINIVESIMIYVLSIAGAMFWIYAGYAKAFEESFKS